MLRLLTLTIIGLATAFPAWGSEPRIYLSSHAPCGRAGAESTLVWARGDSSRVDTLYLTFDPGRACSTFVAVSAKLWVHAMGRDSLGALWEPGAAESPPSWIRVEYGSGPGGDPPFPWRSFGVGVAAYARTSPTAGLFMLAYAVSARGGGTVAAGQPYGFARVILTRPPAGTPGRDDPVCFEWLDASLSFSLSDSENVSDGVRYVGLNTGASGGCGESSVSPARASRRAVWKPPRGK